MKSDEKEKNMSEVFIEPALDDLESVKEPVAKKIEQMLKKGRRYFGSSGAAMTMQASSPDFEDKENLKRETAKDYLDAEREITEFLKKWMKDKPNVVLIDSVNVPDWDGDPDGEIDPEYGIFEGGDTDHIVLIGNEVLLIDTKRWKKKKNYSIDDDGNALMTNKNFPGGAVQMKQNIYSWLDYFEEEEASITGMVCINNEETTVLRNKNWFTQVYRLVELDRFEELLDKKWEEIDDEDKNKINTTLVAQCVVQCIKPFDIYSKVFDMESLKSFR